MLGCCEQGGDKVGKVSEVKRTNLVVSASIFAMEEQATPGLLNGKCHRDRDLDVFLCAGIL